MSRFVMFTALILGMSLFSSSPAQDSSPLEIGSLTNKALAFLATRQAADGSFSAQAGPAVTALVTTSILQHGRTADDPLVAKSLKYLTGFVREDGGIYSEGSVYKNYETSVALMCFAAANKSGKYDQLLKKAEAFAKGLQWDEGEEKSKADPEFGGAGYGKSKRPDLSNTSFFLDALKAVGNDENSEAIQRALVFVSRCQNLESEHNATPFAAKNPDGGFYYTPAGGGQSQAGNTETGGLRSYASMTYAGLKSMVYAGLTPDDLRVKAATEWVKKNYDLKSNPGMGDAGLYYYYNTVAKALSTMKMAELVDAQGKKHNWRQELIAELKSRQQADGSWVNANPKWMEGDPNIVTAYALLTLANCK